MFIGRTDVEAETPILWPPDAKSWLIGKDPDAGKDWRQEEKGTTEDEMVEWHHQLDGCESWIIKKTEHQRNDVSELWCWRRLLRVPWITRRSNQSVLKEISPEYSLKDWCWSWNSNTFAIWCEELTPWKRPWCWERLKVGGEGDDRGWDGWMASPTQWTWVWVNSRSWWWTGRPGVLHFMGSQRVGQN